MAKKFFSNRLNRHYQTGNFMDDIKAVKENVADNADRVAFGKLSSISNNTGTLIADELICPSSEATDTDPTSTAFTGVAMGGNGWTFNSVVWHLVSIASGVLQVGLNYLGQFIWGGGVGTMDVNGINIVAGTSYTDARSYKLSDGTNYFSKYQGIANSVERTSQIIMPGVAGFDNQFAIGVLSPAGQNSEIAQSLDTGAVRTVLKKDSSNAYTYKIEGGGTNLITTIESSADDAVAKFSSAGVVLNDGGGDRDTLINGDTTTIATFDAGLEAVGFGGAAASGKIAKFTGNVEITGNLTVGGTQTALGYALSVMALNQATLTDSQTIYWGFTPTVPSTNTGYSRVYIPKAGTIKAAYIFTRATTAGSNENWSMYIRLNSATDTLIETEATAGNVRLFSNTSLNIAVSAGDYIEIKEVFPVWTTNPADVIRGGYIYIEP